MRLRKKNGKEKKSEAIRDTRVRINTIKVASGIVIEPEAIGRNFLIGCFLSYW